MQTCCLILDTGVENAALKLLSVTFVFEEEGVRPQATCEVGGRSVPCPPNLGDLLQLLLRIPITGEL